VDAAGHDAHFAPRPGVNHARTVGADEAHVRTPLQVAGQAHGVLHRHTLGDAGDEGHAARGGLGHGVGGEGGGHKDEGYVGPGLAHRLFHRVKDRDLALKNLPALAGGDPGYYLGAVGHAGPGVKPALPAGDALHHDAGVAV